MNSIQRLISLVPVDIDFIYPVHLKQLSYNYSNSDKFPDIKSSFEFPPKPIEKVVELLMDGKYELLNFFDIARLLKKLEQDNLSVFIIDKNRFAVMLNELFKQNPKYIQNLILKVIAKILLNDKNKNSFQSDLSRNMRTKEFQFLYLCIEEDYASIQKAIKNQSLYNILKYYGLHKLFLSLVAKYGYFLLENISIITLNDDTYEQYKNNLLVVSDLNIVYKQIDRIINIIENKENSLNSGYLDKVLLNKLGNIENESSNWYKLSVPEDLQERYKRLKGLFEFQRFVNIVEYLTAHPEMYFSSDENTNDENRLKNRSAFWSNYDERFSSVKMWVSEEDYRLLMIDKPVDIQDIKKLKNINNEACMLEFKDNDLLIIEFFRLKDGSNHFNSMIFEGNNTQKIKELLNEYTLDIDLYKELQILSNYTISHKHLWQGWVDKFLRERNIYPNTSILNGKKFSLGVIKLPYEKALGLSDTRKKALAENSFNYEDIIRKSR